MAPKSKKAGKNADPKVAEAAQKKKDQSNMITQLRNAATRLSTYEAGGKTDLNEEQVKELETKKKFLEEYQALGLFDSRKEQLLSTWKGDKSLKTWAEANFIHRTHSSVEQQGRKAYGTKPLALCRSATFVRCAKCRFLRLLIFLLLLSPLQH
jgi:hypothetical protein